MLRHIIKLIWNRRGRNSLLMIEICICFIILFGVLSLTISQYDKYVVPMGFATKNKLIASLNIPTTIDSTTIVETKKAIIQEVRQLPEVKAASYNNGTIPYGGSQWTMGDTDESGRELLSHFFKRDDAYAKTVDLNLVDGRWWNESDYEGKNLPAVVNQKFVDEYFKDSIMIGRHLKWNGEYTIVGVVDHYRYLGEFSEETNGFFVPFRMENWAEDPVMIISLKGNVRGDFEKKLNDVIQEAAGEFSFSVVDMDFKRKRQSMSKWVTIIALIAISSFLIFNVMLGLFGVLWYNIKKRRSEIGLRKALGATKSSITWHFVGEMMVVATFGVLIALFFAIQFPLLDLFAMPDNVYFRAILISLLIVFGLVLFCAFLPSRQAAVVAPAVALHEE